MGDWGLKLSPTSWPTTTVTVANNLNRLKDVTEINLAATNITSLQGGVLWGNSSITTLILPASATSWKLTEVNSYESAPIGYTSENASSANKLSQGIEFLNFTLNTSSTQAKAKKKAAQNAFNQLTETTWSQVASILNMFGRVESSQDGKDENLLAWKESFTDGELTAETVKQGWGTDQNNVSQGTPGSDTLDQDKTGTPYYKLVNNLTWKYTNSSGSITLTIQGDKPNLYRAGYTGNPYAFYQVGFALGDNGKIKTDTTVTVTLKLVGN